MWGLFSKDPAKDFAFETGEQVGQVPVPKYLPIYAWKRFQFLNFGESFSWAS